MRYSNVDDAARQGRKTHVFFPDLCLGWSTTIDGVDTDLCSPGNWAKRCALFFEGGLENEMASPSSLSQNSPISYERTNRISRGIGKSQVD